MAGGHLHALYRHGSSPVHRAAPHLKVLATLGFVVAVVLTPKEQAWAFGLHLAVAVAALMAARIPAQFVAARLTVIVPFLLAAGTLPFLAAPPDNSWGLSVPGLWAAWNVAAKATLGTLASITLAATTEPSELIAGLERLRAPRIVTAILGFMIRYLDLVAAEMGRMRVAMRSRAYRPRWLGGASALGRGVGNLFLRSYERGERIHLAMMARGYSGSLPPAPPGAASVAPMATVAPAAAAWLVLAAALAAP